MAGDSLSAAAAAAGVAATAAATQADNNIPARSDLVVPVIDVLLSKKC
jgi:hypothetical protein